jgi:hypothetical protein
VLLTLDDDELLSLDEFQVMSFHFMDRSESYPSCASQNGRDALGSAIFGARPTIYE